MIKVSFIAIVLAAIGYKEYNPSVEGNWHLRTTDHFTFHFDEGKLIQKLRDEEYQVGTYYLMDDTLKLSRIKDLADQYLIVRQNNKKLILEKVDTDGCTIGIRRLVLERID